MPAFTVANVTPKGVIDFCLSRGVPSDGLLAAAGVPAESVAVPGGRLSAQQAFALWEEAERATGDPVIAEHVTSFMPFGAYRIADYLLLTGSTPIDSLQKFIRSFPVVNSAFELQLTTSPSEAHLELHSRFAPDLPCRFYVEFVFSMILDRLRLAAGERWFPKMICFTHAAPAGMETFHPTFGCTARFNEPVNQMVLDKSFADMTLPHGDVVLSEILDQYGQSLLKQNSTDSFLSEVHKVLSDGFSRGDIRLQTTARKLALSGRSLQRELHGRGTSYRDELDQFRRDLAIDLLRRTEIHEIASLLQFSDVSSFYRAFRRWTGKTPAAFLQS